MGFGRGTAAVACCVLLVGCGGGAGVRSSGSSASVAGASGVAITGRAIQRGTRGPVLVFAYQDLAAGDDPAAREPAAVGIVAPDGGFDLAVPASASLTLVFLADGANDGVIDSGDPVAALASPELSDLQDGDQVQINDLQLDFTHRTATAAVAVTRAGEPPRTPTPVPPA
jgi:hypothetical protein